MSTDRFTNDPWSNSFQSYEDSPFNIRPAPEFATAEVVVASLYRASGFSSVSETSVPTAGREFDRRSQAVRSSTLPGNNQVSSDTWRTVLHGVLESPKQPNQSSRRFLQLNPLIPDVAIYSGSARLSGNSWNPGVLVQRIIQLGADTVPAASALWNKLFSALTVDGTDDIWARWLQQEFEGRKRNGPNWAPVPIDSGPNLPDDSKSKIAYPAKQFVRDLDAIIEAKHAMTRRQWISLLEAILRIGTATHVLWQCDVNDRIWRSVRSILNGEPLPSQDEIGEKLISCNQPYLSYGNPAVPTIRDFASRYLVARLGLNAVLWQLHFITSQKSPLNSISSVHKLLADVSAHREKLIDAGVLRIISDVHDAQARTVACKKGIGSNLVEFARHVLGQRQTANENLRGYDQGYVLRKRGDHLSAPWVVSLGPVAVLALVHCCLREAAGPRSVQRLCQHLRWYGIDVDRDDIAKSDLGRQLRMLGLVLDSPDAESGMLLIPPFETQHTARAGENR